MTHRDESAPHTSPRRSPLGPPQESDRFEDAAPHRVSRRKFLRTNVMVIPVVERRSEVGLRRALGAAKRHVASLVIGGIAGLYPAVRAARLSPTEALRSV